MKNQINDLLQQHDLHDVANQAKLKEILILYRRINKCRFYCESQVFFSVVSTKPNCIIFLLDLIIEKLFYINIYSYIHSMANSKNQHTIKYMLDNYIKINGNHSYLSNSRLLHYINTRRIILINRQQKYKNIKFKFLKEETQLLLRHYYLTGKFRQTARRHYYKYCAYILFDRLPIDVIWLIIKYLSR